MKNLKRVLCFLLMLTFCWSFSACSKKKESEPSNNTTPEIEQPESNDEGNQDEEQEDVVEPEVYTPFDLNDVLDLGSRAIAGFVYNLDVDLNDSDPFDDNIANKQSLFIEASEMLTKLCEFDNISYETAYKGELLSAEDAERDRVNKFYLEHWEEDENGYSKVDVKILISYKNLDVVYTFDYYNFVIETNQKQNAYSVRIATEKSVESGSYNSKATYVILELDGEIKTPSSVYKYDVISFARNKQLTNYSSSVINNSNILNFTRSTFDGLEEKYIGVKDGENYLRTPGTDQYNMIVLNVSELGQDLNLLQGRLAIRSISGLSNAMISCIRT